MTGRFRAYLLRHHVKRTAERDAVFIALKRLGSCRPTELAVYLSGTVSVATTYRTVALFCRIGVAEMIRDGQIELRPFFTHHHHHFVCDQCGKHIRFNDEAIERAVSRFAERRPLFDVAAHSVELTGICPACKLKWLALHKIPLTTDIA